MTKKADRTLCPEVEHRIKKGEIPRAKVDLYYRILDRIEREILPHPIIVKNEFTSWFSRGEFDREDLRHFLVQWSVFSNLFLIAQLKKAINAPTIEALHASKEILMNELGVVFQNPHRKERKMADDIDQELVQAQGTVENGTFHFAAAHFEWLTRMAAHAGLSFGDLGKRRHGSKSTLFFCDELARLYGSEDPHIALGASFGVENWAAAGMWKEQIQGLEIYRKKEMPSLPIGFFNWHDMIEDQHAAGTWEELEEQYFGMDLNEEKFFHGAREMLAGVKAFWDGLNEDRSKREKIRSVS